MESVLSLVAALGLLVLSPLAHKRTLRPSDLITAYLLVKLILGLLCLQFQEEHDLRSPCGMLVIVQPLSTLALLLFELRSKRAVLLQPFANQPPEATTSFLGNWLFLWVNPILWKGYKNILSQDELPTLDEHMSSKSLRLLTREVWDARSAFDTIHPSFAFGR